MFSTLFAFMENNDPKPAVDLIKKSLKVYPYTRRERTAQALGQALPSG